MKPIHDTAVCGLCECAYDSRDTALALHGQEQSPGLFCADCADTAQRMLDIVREQLFSSGVQVTQTEQIPLALPFTVVH